MKSKREIKQFQEFLLNSWPAKHYYFLNGWILRFTEGITSRANSVFPIRYTGTNETLEKDISVVEKAYSAHGLPAVFTMHEYYEPENLKEILLSRGYQDYDHTITLGININDVQPEMKENDFEYIILHTRTKEISEFFVKFSKRNEREQDIIQQINERIIIPKKRYVIVKTDNKVVGTLFGVLVPQGFLYIGNVLVHPDLRRQGIATCMLIKLRNDWAISNGANFFWLQVEEDNTAALELYYKLGFTKLYDYYYMKRG
ncbi:MAG: GNAT family N-acetyltransferase [Promethearchaeota archaeon]